MDIRKEIGHIVKGRAALMGFAILWIIGFHYSFLYPMINGALSAGLVQYSFMLALPALIILFSRIIQKIHLTAPLAFIGSITLELYMLHIYNVPLKYVEMVIDNHNLAVAVTTLLLIPIAYGISRIAAKISPSRRKKHSTPA